MDTADGHMKLSYKAVMPIYINHDVLNNLQPKICNAVDDTDWNIYVIVKKTLL